MARIQRRVLTMAVAITGSLSLVACGGGGFEESSSTSSGASSGSETPRGSATVPTGVALKMLIASSGDAETNAVKEAAAAWGKASGNTVEVTAASNMDQELAQGFAGGEPADVMSRPPGSS